MEGDINEGKQGHAELDDVDEEHSSGFVNMSIPEITPHSYVFNTCTPVCVEELGRARRTCQHSNQERQKEEQGTYLH